MSTKNVMEIIRKLRNPDSKSVLQAVEELRAHGWLSGDALEGACLRFAHLQTADLCKANLRAADLRMANLRNADLSLADLQGADLRRANLTGADLSRANLRDADLHKVNLSKARCLTYGQLAEAKRLRGATMPDGRRYDGRLNLAGDLEFARAGEIDTEDAKAMAAFYGVRVDEYKRGQEWLVEVEYRNIELEARPDDLRRVA